MPSEREQVTQVVRVSADRHLVFVETVAPGLMVTTKWDRADTADGGAATPAQTVGIDDFTDGEFTKLRSTAARMLTGHVAPLRQLQHETWGRGFGPGLAAAFVYAVLLALAAFVIDWWSGSGLLTPLRDWLGSK